MVAISRIQKLINGQKSIGLTIVVFLGLLSTFVSSCTYYENIKPKVVIPAEVKFSVNIIPILNSKCNISGCHSAGGIPPDLSAANAYNSLMFFGYVNIDDPAGSPVYIKITTGSMKNNANDQDRALILEWIKQGALDN